jgi:Asp/Glu/hydantoin racemase
MNKTEVTGGKAVYGASIGILMLEASFPRIVGDIGNARTWPFPVYYKIVKGASPDRIVRHRAEGLEEAFKDATRELVDNGVDGVTTNCGFLSLFQNELAAHCGVPVATSSLMQYRLIRSLLPDNKTVGIVSISSKTLSDEHLAAADIPLDVPIVGTDESGTELSRVILNDENRLDVAAAEADMLRATRALLDKDPAIGAILLECTNMCPYSAAVRSATGLPVFDMYSFVCWFQSGLCPRVFVTA